MSGPALPQLVGLDVGTTSCKAGLFDAGGELLALASAGYPLERPQPAWAEQDPERYWTAAAQCLRELMASPAADPGRLAGIASCGQAPTLILLDAGGAPLRPAIVWQDTRAVAEAEALAADPGAGVLAEWLGVRWPVDASLPLARLLWLRRHEPDTLARTRCVLLPKDLVHLRLTGRQTTDTWSAKGLAHQGTRRPIEAIRALSGLNTSVVPDVLPSDGLVGRVGAAGAAATHLPEGLPVIAGWTDAMAAKLGTGALGRAGLACDVSGTSEVVGLTLRGRPSQTGHLVAAAILDCGRWYLYGPTQASGASLGWALRTIGGGSVSTADALAAAAQAPPGAGGLVFLPYLEGERAPVWDPRARGAFFGLTSGHTAAHLYRAVLEGVAFSVRQILEAAARTGAEAIDEVRLAGGGARLPLWNEIKASASGLPFRPCATSENGVLGAAMLAALGTGIYPDVETASERMVALLDPVPPLAEHRAVYDAQFERYVALYPRIRDLTWG